MSSHNTRLAKLEAQERPPHSLAVGFINRVVDGNDEVVTLNGERFDRVPGEHGDDVRKRAIAKLGPFDRVLFVAWGKGNSVNPLSGEV